MKRNTVNTDIGVKGIPINFLKPKTNPWIFNSTYFYSVKIWMIQLGFDQPFFWWEQQQPWYIILKIIVNGKKTITGVSPVKCNAFIKTRTDTIKGNYLLELVDKMFSHVLNLVHWDHFQQIYGFHKSIFFGLHKSISSY